MHALRPGSLGFFAAVGTAIAFSFAWSPSVVASSIRVVYDSEFQGYAPIVDGIERPDLVAIEGTGRVPEEPRAAEREARRALRRALRGGSTLPSEMTEAPGDDEPRRAFLRRVAITTELEIVDENGRAVSGARIYRYYDPSFYAVNEDDDGARLVGFARFMPFPNPALTILATIARHERSWQDDGFRPVASAPADMDHRRNPFSNLGASTPAPIEYLGRTDDAGRLVSISGIFNLRDIDRFPKAIVPSSLRVGFVVTAHGLEAAFSEVRFTEGGVREKRTIRMLRGRGHELLGSREMRVTEVLIDAIDLDGPGAGEGLDPVIEAALARLAVHASRVPETLRDAATLRARLEIYERIFRRAPESLRERLARQTVDEAPADPTALARLARVLLEKHESSGRGGSGRAEPSDDALRDEAERLSARAKELDPAFLPAYALFDEALRRRDAPIEERARPLRRVLAEAPFSAWCRGRLAALLFDAQRPAEAFDHLRYAPATQVGLGGDRELARALTGHYWRLGLVEKSGFWSFLFTGRAPEDPALRPRRP